MRFVRNLFCVFIVLAACPRPARALDCQTGGHCLGPLCVGGSSTECNDDGIACTDERCNPPNGCVHEPVAARCEDGDPCTTGICDPASGCRQVPATGPACEDGDACTTADRCVNGQCVGQPVRCAADAFACTDEQCIAGACRAVPHDERCSASECSVAACRPDERNADRRGCVVTPSADGTPCSDDGAYCTDDACAAGTCLHVPIDDRCALADECTSSVCVPERADRDEAGCALGSASGPSCAEDGDPCSDDLCQEARCVHATVPDEELCAPIRSVYRRTLGVGSLVRGLLQSLAAETSARDLPMPAFAERLRRLDRDLTEAARMLAGKVDVAAEPRPHTVAETSAQRRARGAAAMIAHAPRDARGLTRAVSGRELRAALGRDYATALRRRTRELRHAVVALKGDLGRIQAVVRSFTR